MWRSAGVRRLLLLNSHGGQPQVLDIVARTLRRTAGMFVVHASWMSLGMPDGLFDETERRFGIHGGDIETSLMLHLRPDLVRMQHGRAISARSAADLSARSASILEAEGRVGFGWLTQDLNPAGACGDAASQATGREGPSDRRVSGGSASCVLCARSPMLRASTGIRGHRMPSPRREGRTGMDIDGFIAALDGITAQTDPVLIKRKSRDFYWYSPVLKRQLDDKLGDVVVTPRDEAELLRIAAARPRATG